MEEETMDVLKTAAGVAAGILAIEILKFVASQFQKKGTSAV